MKTFLRRSLKLQKGITLTETVIYMGIISILGVSIISIALQLIKLKTTADSIGIISSEVTNLFEKLSTDVRNCDSFTVVDGSTLEVVKDGDTSQYFLQDEKVVFNDGTEDFLVTTNLVQVTELTFTDWTSINSDNLLHIEIYLHRGERGEHFQTSIHKR